MPKTKLFAKGDKKKGKAPKVCNAYASLHFLERGFARHCGALTDDGETRRNLLRLMNI
jgi:hypothetical protein